MPENNETKKPNAICPHCGSEDFYVHEFVYYKAYTDEKEKNVIHCENRGDGIDLIECAKCGEEITELSLTPWIEFKYD